MSTTPAPTFEALLRSFGAFPGRGGETAPWAAPLFEFFSSRSSFLDVDSFYSNRPLMEFLVSVFANLAAVAHRNSAPSSCLDEILR
jgi:hypothetical protein